MDGNLVLQSVYSDSPFTNTYKASLKKLFRCLRGSPYDYVSSDRRYHFIVPVEKFKQDCLESEFATEFELNSLSQVLDFVKMSVEIKSSDPSEFFDTEIFKVLGKRLKLYLSFKTDVFKLNELNFESVQVDINSSRKMLLITPLCLLAKYSSTSLKYIELGSKKPESYPQLMKAKKYIIKGADRYLHYLCIFSVRDFLIQSFPDLKSFSFSNASLMSHVDNLQLFLNRHGRSLRALDLSYSDFGDDGLIKISSALGNIRVLDLTYNKVGDSGIEGLAPHLRQIETLKLGFNNLSIRGFEILFDGLSATKISSLDLSFSLGPFPWNVLAAKILKLKHLKSLNLSGVVLRQENLKHLCDILSLSNIESISLMGSFNAVPSSVLKRELPAVFKCMIKIKSLNLSYNKLNPEILWSLTKSMKELTMRVLKLSNTNILDSEYFTRRKLLSEGFVFRFIESVKNVEVLDVSGNNLGYEGAKLMLKELKERNKKIRENVVRIENELIFCREINDSELRIAREKRFRKELRELKELEKRFKVLAFYNCNVAFKAPGGIIDELKMLVEQLREEKVKVLWNEQ